MVDLKIKTILLLRNIFTNKMNKRKPVIPFLVFWVGTKCTLKCKMCCNLIPYLPQKSSNAKAIMEDLKFIYGNFDITSLQIQGGEPFTHPQIIKIIDTVGKLNNIPKIEIATNGTVKLSDKIIQTLKKYPNIVVRVSNYDCTAKIREQFISQLKYNNINHAVYEFIYGNNTWFSTGGIGEKRENDDTIVQSTYDKCDEKGCVTYYDGEIYTCGKIPAIRFWYNSDKNINCCSIKIRQMRIFRNGKKFQNKIKEFYQKYNIFKEECRYCSINNEKFPAGEQLNKEELQYVNEKQNDRNNRRSRYIH